jgi:predicted RNA-binding protein Jag
VDQAEYDQTRAGALARLGEEAFERAWQEGQTMSMEEAITAALEAPTLK